jgi:hypothetical protein|nr:MAG TPA: hypothetical protein [Caudoviricetes sp.]
MINRYLTAVSDADLLDAASDALVDAGWSLDEDRELPFEAGYYEDPEAAFEVDSEWDGIQADAVSRLWDRLSDEERVELWLHDCAGQDPDDPVDAETVWERMEAAVMEQLGSVYEDTGARVTEACTRALRLTSAEALARVLGLYEVARADARRCWGEPSRMRAFDVEHGTVVVRSEGGAVETRLKPAFEEGDDEGAVIVEMLGDALREVGLD